MTAYAIVDLVVHDPAGFSRYLSRVSAIVAKHHGRYLSRGGRITTVFGSWKPRRIVIIEFPGPDDLMQCFSCEEYRDILHLREESATGSMIMVEGSGSESHPFPGHAPPSSPRSKSTT